MSIIDWCRVQECLTSASMWRSIMIIMIMFMSARLPYHAGEASELCRHAEWPVNRLSLTNERVEYKITQGKIELQQNDEWLRIDYLQITAVGQVRPLYDLLTFLWRKYIEWMDILWVLDANLLNILMYCVKREMKRRGGWWERRRKGESETGGLERSKKIGKSSWMRRIDRKGDRGMLQYSIR